MPGISTANDLISLCLKTSGAVAQGQTPSATDANDCLSLLQLMIAQYNRERWMVYHLVDTAFTSTGAQSYTVGTGGDFNIPRPDQIESAYARLLPITNNQPVDFALGQIFSREDYSAIGLKGLQSFTGAYYYDAGYPNGSVFFWPIGTAGQFEYHIVTKSPLPTITSLATPIVLPPEYMNLLLWDLSARMRPLFGLPPDPSISAYAKAAKAVIRSANTQIPVLSQPVELLNPNAGFDATAGNFNGIPWGI